jgi:hypothetical protein
LIRQGPAPEPEWVLALMRRLIGVDITRGPVCHQRHLRRVGTFPPGELRVPEFNTS